MQEFLQSLLSRKFLLTVSGAVALWSMKQYDQVVVLLLGYVGVEGGADLVSRYKGGTLTASDIENVTSQNDEVDVSSVTTGKPTPLFNEEEKEG